MDPRILRDRLNQERVKSWTLEIHVTFKDNWMGNEEQHTYKYPEEMKEIAMSQIVKLLKQKNAMNHSRHCRMEVTLDLVELL